ncbi:hypothetical protein M1M86_00950, partial [Dehalococcoidales bacterium]|nr:hypothetical protein [Dehalococcoidales bacterium]
SHGGGKARDTLQPRRNDGKEKVIYGGIEGATTLARGSISRVNKPELSQEPATYQQGGLVILPGRTISKLSTC